MPKHSSSKQKSSKQSSAWSEWVWSDEHGSHYCYRTKKNGEIEYQWENAAQASSAQEHQDETTPRGIEQITEDVHNLSVTDEPEHEDPESAYRLEADPADSGHGQDSGYGYNLGSQTGGYEAPKTSKSKRKGKTVSYAEVQETPETTTPDDEAPLDPFYGARSVTEADHQGESLSTEADYSHTNGYDPNAQQDYETQVTEAMSASDQHNFGYPDEGESSADPAYGAYSEEAEDDGQSTPRAGGPVHDSELEHGQLDSRFKVEPSKKFKQGAIFKVVWSEPQGVTTNNTLVTEKKLMRDPYGGSFYVGSRRFIVVATDKGHSTCVPILTYQGRGCGKPGVHPMNHGIIHEKNRSAQVLRGEPELGFEPVKAKLTVEGERLQKESRVNYAKLTTIEHNIKVFFIGSVVKDEIHYIRDAVDYCWERKS